MEPSEIQKAFFPWTASEIESAFDPWGILKQLPSGESVDQQEKIKEEPNQPKPWDAVLGDGIKSN